MLRLMVETFLINQQMMILKHIKTLEKLLRVKEMITQLFFIRLSLFQKKKKKIIT